MEPTEPLRPNSRRETGFKLNLHPLSTKARALHKAYAPPTRKPSPPYHPTLQPRDNKAVESVRCYYEEKIKKLDQEIVKTHNKLRELSIRHMNETKSLKQKLNAAEKKYETAQTQLAEKQRECDNLKQTMKVKAGLRPTGESHDSYIGGSESGNGDGRSLDKACPELDESIDPFASLFNSQRLRTAQDKCKRSCRDRSAEISDDEQLNVARLMEDETNLMAEIAETLLDIETCILNFDKDSSVKVKRAEIKPCLEEREEVAESESDVEEMPCGESVDVKVKTRPTSPKQMHESNFYRRKSNIEALHAGRPTNNSRASVAGKQPVVNGKRPATQ